MERSMEGAVGTFYGGGSGNVALGGGGAVGMLVEGGAVGMLYGGGGGCGNVLWRRLWKCCMEGLWKRSMEGAVFEISVSVQNLRSLSHTDEEVADLPTEYWTAP